MAKKSLFHYARHPSILKTSVKTALLVGTVLAFINHFDSIIALRLSRTQMLQIVITYFVPFTVATYAAAKHAQRSGELEDKPKGLRRTAKKIFRKV